MIRNVLSRRGFKAVLTVTAVGALVGVGGVALAAPGQSDNLARTGTPSASYTSAWESVAAINDGIDPPSSNDTVNRRWGTWPNRGEQWAQVQWSTAQTLRSADIYFFDDNQGIDLPASWRLQTWNGTAYVDVAGASGYPVVANRYNAVTFTAVSTTRLRVVLQSTSASSVGLLEVRAYATTIPTGTTTTPPPTTPGTRTFTNPLSLHGPDPFLQYYNGYYYLATTTWNSTITMRKSRTLGGLATAPDTQIFNLLTRPTGRGTMWAPEFHLLTGPNGTRWYFYYTAGDEQQNLGSQRIHVLESAGLDPMGPYTFKADLLDPTANNTWELDGSILQLNGNLYLMGTYYAGNQPLFIKPLSNPWTVSGTRRLLASPTLSWETIGGAVAEGPEALQRNGKTFIIYSASHCSTPDYKMGMLTYNGGDPLLSSSWVKSPNPVFQRSNANGVYAPGHGNFFTSPDGTESWMAYHANNSSSGGCDMNRTTRAQKFTWNADGTPNFGTPASLSTALPVPAGEPAA